MQGLKYDVTDFLISICEKNYASSKPTHMFWSENRVQDFAVRAVADAELAVDNLFFVFAQAVSFRSKERSIWNVGRTILHVDSGRTAHIHGPPSCVWMSVYSFGQWNRLADVTDQTCSNQPLLKE